MKANFDAWLFTKEMRDPRVLFGFVAEASEPKPQNGRKFILYKDLTLVKIGIFAASKGSSGDFALLGNLTGLATLLTWRESRKACP